MLLIQNGFEEIAELAPGQQPKGHIAAEFALPVEHSRLPATHYALILLNLFQISGPPPVGLPLRQKAKGGGRRWRCGRVLSGVY